MEYNNLSVNQLDALGEVCNIGSGNAATALSQLLNRKVEMTVPAVNIIPYEDVINSKDGEEIAIGVIVRVLGDIPGNILMVFTKETAFNLIEKLTGTSDDNLTDMGASVVCEIGNILSSAFMNAISQLTNLMAMPSVPAVSHDLLAAILSTTFIESGQFGDYALDLETEFIQDETKINGHFYYVPEPGSLEKILNILGVN